MARKGKDARMERDIDEYPVTGSSALKHDRLAYDDKELSDIRAHYNPKAQRVRREEEKAKVPLGSSPMKVAAALFLILFVAVSYGVLVMRESGLAQNQSRIKRAQEELDELRRQNSVLQVRVETVDSQWMIQQATDRLGMQLEPESYVKIVLPTDDQ